MRHYTILVWNSLWTLNSVGSLPNGLGLLIRIGKYHMGIYMEDFGVGVGKVLSQGTTGETLGSQ